MLSRKITINMIEAEKKEFYLPQFTIQLLSSGYYSLTLVITKLKYFVRNQQRCVTLTPLDSTPYSA